MDLDEEEYEATRRLHRANKKKHIAKEYILALLKLQVTRLKCINLGYSAFTNKEIKAELDLIEETIKLINSKL